MSIPAPKSTDTCADVARRRDAILAKIGMEVFSPRAAALCELVLECLDLPPETGPDDTLSRCRRVLDCAGKKGVTPSDVCKEFLATTAGFYRLPAARRDDLKGEVDADIKTLEALLDRDSREEAVQVWSRLDLLRSAGV